MIEQFSCYIQDKSKDYIIFDIGARDCLQSIEFYNKFPNAKIYSFECNPNTIDICKKNIEKYRDRITLIEGAVCDYDGLINFYPIDQKKTKTTWADGNPGASSLFKSNGNYTIEEYVQYEIISKCHRLDSVMKRYNIPRVDIIWMDLQGAELLALRGLGDFLIDLKFIYTEVSHIEMYNGQVMFKEINDFMLNNGFKLKNKLSFWGWQEDAVYEKIKQFDIVIPIGPNDIDLFKKQIEYTKKNVLGYRNIYLISFDSKLTVEGCITVPENIFPFSLETVANYHGKSSRNGWYLQQLLKYYAGSVIPNILEKYLVIDADVFFIKPTIFYENDKVLFNYSNEYHTPYFTHMKKLHPDLIKIDEYKSGICHHMLFEREYLDELLSLVENNHDNEPFYNIFLKNVTENETSGASEYEIYFNFMLSKHPDKVETRMLKWENTADTLDRLPYYINANWDYISFPWYYANSQQNEK